VEIEQGTKHKASGLADVLVIACLLFYSNSFSSSTVATYQTLRQAERVKKFDPSTLKAIVIDEAHHAAAPSYAP
jgi:ATP-dependent helicase IRC3